MSMGSPIITAAPFPATMHRTVHAERWIARSMYTKGKSFIAAVILLRQRGGYEFVVLHLVCQGVEIVLKALMLLKDFTRYEPRLKEYGHKLDRLVGDALSEFGLHPARAPLEKEIGFLSALYSKHLLRYNSDFDIFVDPNTIESERVFRRLAAVLRLAERELRREGGTATDLSP